MWDVYCMRLSELQPFVLISGIFKKKYLHRSELISRKCSCNLRVTGLFSN